jgi:hypothetical protein
MSRVWPVVFFAAASAFRLRPRVWTVLLFAARAASAFRIPLTFDARSPFLQHSREAREGNSFDHDTFSAFSWSNVFLGRQLHQSELVELGPRGVRFIRAPVATPAGAECAPSELALCAPSSGEGWILPSEGKWGAAPRFDVSSNGSALEDGVLRLFARETACHGESQGAGRAYRGGGVYSVTACDILQGQHFMVYAKPGRVAVYPQTFGPIAYFLIIVSATISTGGIAYLSQRAEAPKKDSVSIVVHQSLCDVAPPRAYLSGLFNLNALCSIVVCVGLVGRGATHFHTRVDGVAFGAGALSGLFYVACVARALYFAAPTARRNSYEIDSCMHALGTVATSLYRTPETPYASILILFMAFRIWEKAFLYCHGRSRALGAGVYLDLGLALLNFQLMCEAGARPQYVFRDAWAFHFVLVLFLSFCLVKTQWAFGVTLASVGPG